MTLVFVLNITASLLYCRLVRQKISFPDLQIRFWVNWEIKKITP